MIRWFVWLSFFIFIACDSLMEFESSDLSAQRAAILPSPSFKVAFVGDQGISEASREVLRLIRRENVGLLVIPGDFDYKDRPDLWEDMLRDELGDLPILAAVGNHDLPKWPQYADNLNKRLARMPKAKCSGEIGIKHNCLYEGVQFVISGVGTTGNDHQRFLEESLKSSAAAFKICVWHKNQRKMQVGAKTDEVGWEAYETCRKAGAMVVTAHEHSYSRTYLLSDFSRQEVASKSSTMTLEPGKSLAFVSGLGGQSIRKQERGGNYWGKIYTSTQNAKSGAVFCTFNAGDNPRAVVCEFKNVSGEVVDRFGLETRVNL